MTEIKNMGELWSKFLTQVQQQGFSVMLLVAVVIYFQMQNDTLQKKVDDCNDNQLKYYQSQIEDLKDVVRNNTKALDQLNQSQQK